MHTFEYKGYKVKVVFDRVGLAYKWFAIIDNKMAGKPEERSQEYPTAEEALNAGIAFAKVFIDQLAH